MKNNKKKIIIASILLVLILFLAIAPLGLCYVIYQDNFGKRYKTETWIARSLNEFNGLHSQRYNFKSNKGQILVGYKYYKETDNVKGIVVIAHGLGEGGHNSYMDVANYLATCGYIVFAYDATGNDESEGNSVVGIPQGLIDLDYAIQFIKENDEFDNLPIMLFGHSWGAYSVGSVLNIHPDIEAAVMIAGFNKSLDILREEGLRLMGDSFSILLPYFSVIERIKFGNYSSYSCIDGFDASNARVMIVHSMDDNMISFEGQFNMFLDRYRDNRRFDFVTYKHRGHDYVYYTYDSIKYKEELYSQFEEYVGTLDVELTAEIKTEHMKNNINKSILFDLDTELMDRIVSFYDNYTSPR